MAIHFTCPQCGKQQSVPAYSVGKAFKCQCGHSLVVPGEAKISGWTFLMFAAIAVAVPMFYYLLCIAPAEAPEQPAPETVATSEEPASEPIPKPLPESDAAASRNTAEQVDPLPPPFPLAMTGSEKQPSRKVSPALNALRLGDHAFAEGSYEDALAQYRRAATLDPDSPQAKERVVSALFNVKRYDQAIEEAKAILTAGAGEGHASYLLGCMYRRLGDFRDALTRLRAAVELDPTNLAARHELAIVLEEMGRPQEAIGQWYEAVSICRKLLEHGQNDARLHAELGTFLGRVGNTAEADEHLQTATLLGRDDVGLQYILAKAYGELGRTREAQQHAEAAQALGHKKAERLLQKLGASAGRPPGAAP